MKLYWETPEGGKFPPGIGLAWRDVLQQRAIGFPVPFNLLARCVREGWWRLCYPTPLSREELFAVDVAIEANKRTKRIAIEVDELRNKNTVLIDSKFLISQRLDDANRNWVRLALLLDSTRNRDAADAMVEVSAWLDDVTEEE